MQFKKQFLKHLRECNFQFTYYAQVLTINSAIVEFRNDELRVHYPGTDCFLIIQKTTPEDTLKRLINLQKKISISDNSKNVGKTPKKS